jgi:hypothetical protein
MKKSLHLDSLNTGLQAESQVLQYNAHIRAAREGKNKRRPYAFSIIAIEHDVGSLAKEAANALSREIGWQVFDKEIVEYIAENAHLRENVVRELDEKAQNFVHDEVERLLRLLFEGESFGEVEYHQALLKTLATLRAHGEAILVGHGGAFAFEDKSCLSIRITASSDVRAKRLCRRWKEPVEKVQKHMHESDQEIKEFIHFHFRKNRDDLTSYDLIFNTDHLPTNKIVNAVLEVLHE